MKHKQSGITGFLSQCSTKPSEKIREGKPLIASLGPIHKESGKKGPAAPFSKMNSHPDIHVVTLGPLCNDKTDYDLAEEQTIERFSLIAGEVPNMSCIEEGWVVLYDWCENWDELHSAAPSWPGSQLMRVRTELMHGLRLLDAMGVITYSAGNRLRDAVNTMLKFWFRHENEKSGEQGMTIYIDFHLDDESARESLLMH